MHQPARVRGQWNRIKVVDQKHFDVLFQSKGLARFIVLRIETKQRQPSLLNVLITDAILHVK